MNEMIVWVNKEYSIDRIASVIGLYYDHQESFTFNDALSQAVFEFVNENGTINLILWIQSHFFAIFCLIVDYHVLYSIIGSSHNY